jgi:hypothetical protein
MSTEQSRIERPDISVDTLDYNGSETHNCAIEGEITRDYYECPNCEKPITTWMDCPWCYWYDEDVWARTLAERGETA